MRILEKTELIILSLFILCGCAATKEKEKENVNVINKADKNIGEQLKQLDVKGLKQKISNRERFIIVITQSTSSESTTMKRTLIPYFREHQEIPFFEIEVDMLGDKVKDIEKNIDELIKLAPGFQNLTPEYFYYDEGIVQIHESGEMSEIGWNNFMIDTEFVKGDKKEETEGFSLHIGDYLKESSTDQVTGMMEKNDFYLLVAKEERFSELFTKTMKEYTDIHKQKVYLLNHTKQMYPNTEQEAEIINRNMEIIDKMLMTNVVPSLYHIKEGKVIDVIEDNASLKEVEEWFKRNR